MVSGISTTILYLEDIKAIVPDLSKVKILKKEDAYKIQALIYDGDTTTLKILTTNNFPNQLKQLLEMLGNKGLKYEVFYTDMNGFYFAYKEWYDQIEQAEAITAQDIKTKKLAAGKGAIDIMNKLFTQRETMDPGDFILEIVRLSFQAGASDLHFQSEEKGIIMRIRIDGVLEEVLIFSHDDFRKYLQKIKFISGVKINVESLPQDGRFSFESSLDGVQQSVDARVNIMPGLLQENIVIRFLDNSKSLISLENLGFQDYTYKVIKKHLQKNHGMILVTGPTGSGKTTTLYAVIRGLNDGRKKIITLEDPIEYQIAGIEQSQINESKGYTFELGLKAIFRHDPDIILVGETRTLETAEISINASLTGHLVFTTLHTNSAIESINRLLNMGIKSYMLAPALNLICAQRLVRKLCVHCATSRKAEYPEEEAVKEAIKKINDTNGKIQLKFNGMIPQSNGCEYCNGTGYKGRIAIIETLEITDEIKKLIVDMRPNIEIFGKARQQGFLTLTEDGIIKMLQGITTLDEIRRVI